MTTAIEIFGEPSLYPNLLVQQHVIIHAVRRLSEKGDSLAALTLIRGAYNSDGKFASLDEAKQIYNRIIGDWS